MKDRPIDYKKALPDIGGVSIEQILVRFGIRGPKTAGELAKIASNEVDMLRNAIGALQFGSRIRNTPNAPLRRAIGEALVFALWEPIIPRMVEICGSPLHRVRPPSRADLEP